MSLIFETLQKLNRSAVAADTEETAARTRRNTYALKSVLLSPVTVLLLALLVFGVGYGLVFGLRHLQRQARLNPSVVAAAQGPAPETAVPGRADPETFDVPPPPDIRHLEGGTGAVAAEPAEAIAAPPAMAEATFSDADVPPPPEAQMTALAKEVPTFSPAGAWRPPPPATEETFSVAAGPDARRSGDGVPQASDDFPPGEFSPPGGGLSVPLATEAVPTATTAGQGPLETQSDARPGLAATARPMANTAANKGLYAAIDEDVAVPTGVDGHAMATAPAMTGGRQEPLTATAPLPDGGVKQAQRPVKRMPIPRYTELVNRLQTAVANGDAQAAEKLLGDFAAVKGKDHPYLLKLKAYRYMQAGDFVAAERLLNQVLARDQTDRDASLNLVVVEANTGRIDAARRRVARLVELYPEDETLAAMGRRLE
jgi:Flp pilus assembly protein TadD